MPTTEFAIAIRDAAGQDGLFTGKLKLDGVMLVPELCRIGAQDGAALDQVWSDRSDTTAQRIVALAADNAAPGIEFRVVEIRRATP